MVQSVLYLTASNLAMRGVSMLFQIWLSEQVGAAGLGLLQLIMTVNAFAFTLGTSGIRVAAMYLTAEEFGHRRYGGIRSAMCWCIGSGLLLSTLVGFAMVLGAKFLAQQWIGDLRAIASVRLLGFTLPITCLSSILCGYFTASDQVKKLVPIEIGDRVASVLLTVWLLQCGKPGDISHACVSIIGGGSLAGFLSVIVLLAFLLRDLRRYGKPKETLHMGRRLRKFCIPVALNDYLRSGLGTLEQFLIPYGLTRSGNSRTRALEDYGTIQGMVFPIMMFLSTLLFSLSDLLVPRLARCKAEGSRDRLRQITNRCMRGSFLFSAMVAGLIFVLAKPLGILFYDSSRAGIYLRIFAPLLPVLYLDCIVDGMHKGLGEQIYCVRVNTLTNFLDVIGLFLLLPKFGIGGYFLTYTVTHVLNFSLSLRRLMKVSHYAPDLRRVATTVLTGIAAVWFVSTFRPAAAAWSDVFLSGGLYLTLHILLWLLTKKDGS